MKGSLAFALVLVLAACGPSVVGNDDGGSPGDGGGPPPPPPAGSLRGTVWAPGNAIGAVPDGYEIPVAGALVYLAGESPPAIPDEAYCDRCEHRPAAYVLSDPKGNFQLNGIGPGEHLLVIEKAQFRLETTIVVPEGVGVDVPAAQSTLPSRHAPDEGLWIPRVAIAIGDSDHIEDIFGKIGVLDVDGGGTVIESTFGDTDRVVLYGNPIDPPYPAHHAGTISELFTDLEEMKRFHIIFVPCNYETDLSALATPAVRQNIRDYVAAGGKLYVTDWSAEWADAAFPEFIQFDATIDTTPAMAASGVIGTGDGDFGHFALHARVEDDTLATWLDGQKAPLVIPTGGEELDFPSEYAEGVIDASDFVIEQNWTLIRDLPEVVVGDTTLQAKTWISGDYNGTYYPHTVTFEPSCGRVLYSTYHTAQQPHQHLVPQERVLLHLIMEIGVCNDGPIVD
jgi:hypothetical protein